MDSTLGVDLASQSNRTAICVIAWDSGRAEVRALARGRWNGDDLTDRLLSRTILGRNDIDGGWGDTGHPVKTAIDAPFGWPQPYVQALEAHHQLRPWPGELDASRGSFERRATDIFVHEHARKLPLSVSTDRIAYCAMRCAVILGHLAPHLDAEQLARNGSGLVVEAYPDAALRCWLPDSWANARENPYKGAGEPARYRRRTLLTVLLEQLGSGFGTTEAQRDACVQSDDCLDALVCALLARAATRGATIAPADPEHRRLALTEGWIHLPRPGGLRQLV